MAYMRDSTGRRLDTFEVADADVTLTQAEGDARYATETVANLIAGQFPSPDLRRIIGPVTSDLPTVNLSIAPNGAIYNKAYAITSNTLPVGWPVDSGDAPITISGNYIGYVNAGVGLPQPRMYRFMSDSNRVAMLMSSGASGQLVYGDFYVFVDGAPVSLTAYDPPNGVSYTEFVFASAKPRLIEVLTTGGLSAVYCSLPYRCWQPPPLAGIKALLVGDSYSAGVTPIGGTLGAPTYGDCIQGFSSRLGIELGIGHWSIDAFGGTGYVRQNGGSNNYNDRRASHIARAPNVIAVGGGGANDLLAGFTTAQIITAATTYFTGVRAALPNCKLICLEGFSPPVGFSGFNASYTAIRAALQTALASVGVYYIDIATSSAWLDGSGYVGATTGNGNSDLYVGNDGAHLSPAGNTYVLKRLAPKLRLAIADNGALLNTLI